MDITKFFMAAPTRNTCGHEWKLLKPRACAELCGSSTSGICYRHRLSPLPASTPSKLDLTDTGRLLNTTFTPLTEAETIVKEFDMTGSVRPCGLSKFHSL